MKKYYRVKKDNFLWKEGAILSNQEKDQYVPIEDIWNNIKSVGSEYISARIIEDENNSEYFERVYPDTIQGSIYRTKDQLIDLYKKSFS